VRTGKPLVLGIGNLLLGDEGIGVLAAKRLAATEMAAQAEIVDGGTGGFHLLALLHDHEHVILIDAALDGRPPGTITRLRPRFAADFPKSLSAHDIGLRDLVEAAVLLGGLPRIDLITVSIEAIGSMGLAVSDPVLSALAGIEETVRGILEEGGAGAKIR